MNTKVKYLFIFISLLITSTSHAQKTSQNESCDTSFYVPKSFCPDCDGINDVFIAIFGCEPVLFKMEIYDRWGELIFETKDFNRGWDGAIKKTGMKAKTDDYFWRINYYYKIDAKKYVKTGQVALIR